MYHDPAAASPFVRQFARWVGPEALLPAMPSPPAAHIASRRRSGRVPAMQSGAYNPFPNTHWSLVHRAGLATGESRREALATLLTRYSPALESYLLHVRRIDRHAAQDLLHAFIADRLLSSELLANADASRGRFRSLLLTSLNNFVISTWRSTSRRSATGLDDASLPPDPEPAPDAAAEAAWARTLLQNVLAAMRQECATHHRNDVWTVFESRLLAEIEGREPVRYEALAQSLSLGSPTQAANLLVTGKRMFARLLRSAVGEYESDPAAIDAEIADLHRILASAPHGQE